MVWRLHQRVARLGDHPAHRHLQEGAGGHVVAVEDADELTLGLRHGIVQVAGLGVQVVVAGDVADAAFGGELAEFLAPAVIEQVDADLLGRPVHRDGAQHGGAHDRHRLVVGRDIHVDGRPQRDVVRHRDRLALQRPERLHVAEHQHDDRIHLGHGQADAQHQLGEAAEVQRLGHAPEDIAQRDGEAEHHEEDGDRSSLEAVGDEEHDRGGHGQDRLLARVQRNGGDRDQQRQPDDAADDVDQPAA
jgi:hypothetical protein